MEIVQENVAILVLVVARKNVAELVQQIALEIVQLDALDAVVVEGAVVVDLAALVDVRQVAVKAVFLIALKGV